MVVDFALSSRLSTTRNPDSVKICEEFKAPEHLKKNTVQTILKLKNEMLECMGSLSGSPKCRNCHLEQVICGHHIKRLYLCCADLMRAIAMPGVRTSMSSAMNDYTICLESDGLDQRCLAVFRSME